MTLHYWYISVLEHKVKETLSMLALRFYNDPRHLHDFKWLHTDENMWNLDSTVHGKLYEINNNLKTTLEKQIPLAQNASR